MIEIRPDTSPSAQLDAIDEVVASGASVHLEVLDANALMLIIEDAERHVHLRITHRGRSPLRVWEYESFPVEKPRCLPPIG
jgi:hypothetical protein